MSLRFDSAGRDFSASRTIAVTHAAFAGHFPGRPVLPGVVLLAEALDAIRCDPACAAALGATPLLLAAKFLAPVGPGSELQIRCRLDAASLGFEISVDGAAVASGRYRAQLAR